VHGGPHEFRIGFTSELGLALLAGPDEGTIGGRAHVVPELCVPEAGVLRPSVLLTWADSLTGSLANEFTLPSVCMTVDLDVRVVRPIPAGTEVTGVGRILKTGRTVTVGEATFTVDGEPVAVSLASFVASPRPQDVAVSAVRGAQRLQGRPAVEPPAPVAELLGARRVEPGVVEADRHERILNWAETVQGGAVAALAEEAVLSQLDPPVPTALAVRYLSSVRDGPMRAVAHPFGDWTRVEVVDTGRDRLVAVAVAR
jgi:acyl-coenzyme A thioesterase PaaI-like protein